MRVRTYGFSVRRVDVLDGGSGVSLVGILGSPEAGNDFVSGQGGEGERRDEVLRGPGHDHVHVECMLLQFAHQFRGFIRSDAASDADCDLHELRVQRRGCGVQGYRCSD